MEKDTAMAKGSVFMGLGAYWASGSSAFVTLVFRVGFEMGFLKDLSHLKLQLTRRRQAQPKRVLVMVRERVRADGQGEHSQEGPWALIQEAWAMKSASPH